MLKAATTRAHRTLSFANLVPLLGAALVVLLPAAAGAGNGEAPRPPANVTLTAASSSSLSISWEAPRPRGSRLITGYELFVDGASAGTASGLSYEFASLQCARVYTLGVEAIDNTGAHSNRASLSASTSACPAPEPAAPVSTSTTTTGTTHTFSAVADSRVHESYPTSNYGTSSYIRVDGATDPDVESYVRFDVSGLAGSAQSATLRVYTTSSGARPIVYATSSDWLERGINWSNRPARVGSPSDETGSVSSSRWIEWDVSEHVAGNGAISFVLASNSTDGVNMSSRDSGVPPQLVVTAGSGSAPPPSGDTTAPTAPAALVATAINESSASLAWTASTDNVGVTGYAVYRDGLKLGTTAVTTYSSGGLACGKTYTYAVEAFDAAGNVSPRAQASFATAACPPAGSVCTTTLAPGGSLGTFLNGLKPGEIGCLRGGIHSAGDSVTWSASGGTVQAYPGERPVVVGTRIVMSGADQTLRGFEIRDVLFADGETVQISGTRARVEAMQLGNANEHGILLNSSARDVTITRNYIHDVGNDTLDHGIYVQGSGHVITNNVIVRPTGYGVHLYSSPSNVVVAQNTLVGSTLRAGILIRTSGTGIRVVNNVVAGNATHGINYYSCGGSCVIDQNLAWDNPGGAVSSAGAAVVTNTTLADPQFVDAEFRVAGTSPALDSARPDFSYSADRDGVSRPQGGAPDKGAYER